MSSARYDGLADWYDVTCATGESALVARDAVLRLLGRGPGRLIDVGCGTGSHTAAFAEASGSNISRSSTRPRATTLTYSC